MNQEVSKALSALVKSIACVGALALGTWLVMDFNEGETLSWLANMRELARVTFRAVAAHPLFPVVAFQVVLVIGALDRQRFPRGP